MENVSERGKDLDRLTQTGKEILVERRYLILKDGQNHVTEDFSIGPKKMTTYECIPFLLK